MAQRLKAGDGHTKLFAGVEVLHRHRQGFFHQTHGLGTQGRGTHVHRQLQSGQSIPCDELGGCVCQVQLAHATAVLCMVGMAGVGGGTAWHQEQSLLAVRNRWHQEAMGVVTCWYQALVTRDLPCATHLLGGGVACVQVVARALFMVGQHQQGLATGQTGQPFGFQVFGSEGLEHRGANPGVGQRFEHHATPQLLHRHHALGGPHVHSAISVLHIQATQAQFGHGLVSAGRKTTSRDHTAPLVKAVSLVHPFADCVAQLLLFV